MLSDKPLPVPMLLPHNVHFFNWNPFSLWQKEVNEETHHRQKEGKGKEQTKFYMAKHCREDLCNDKGEYHIDRDIH